MDQEVLNRLGNLTLHGCVKPFLKWVGGKTQILEEVLEMFPQEVKNYHEPFLGGGSVLLGLLSSEKTVVREKIYASDSNPALIGLYKNVQSCPDALMAEVRKLIDDMSRCKNHGTNRKASTLEEALASPESYYYWVRSRFNATPVEEKQTPVASAMFLFLNKTCFRGMHREGPKGFNVPFGNYKNPTILDENHLREVSQLIRDVEFTACSFEDALARVEEGDFVYLDPPYAPESNTSFVSYTAEGFGMDQHNALFDWCHKLHQQKARFVMSNAEVQMVTNAFPTPAYIIITMMCRRAIHSKKPDTNTNEVLITNQLDL